jgi:putative transposase
MEKPIRSARPKIPQAQIDLIKQMANENPLWGAPRIHGELLKLGFDISEATVQRYMPKRQHRTTRQRWKTFLKNHSAQIVSVDFLVVPTITFRLLYVLVFLSHDRRRIIHFNVTDHPTAEWASQQLRNAFCGVTSATTILSGLTWGSTRIHLSRGKSRPRGRLTKWLW